MTQLTGGNSRNWQSADAADLLFFIDKEGNKLIYRCRYSNCHYSRDITEDDYRAMEQRQKEGVSKQVDAKMKCYSLVLEIKLSPKNQA